MSHTCPLNYRFSHLTDQLLDEKTLIDAILVQVVLNNYRDLQTFIILSQIRTTPKKNYYKTKVHTSYLTQDVWIVRVFNRIEIQYNVSDSHAF